MTTKISTTIPCGIGTISVNCAVIEHVFLLCLFVSVCASINIGDILTDSQMLISAILGISWQSDAMDEIELTRESVYVLNLRQFLFLFVFLF